MPNLLDSHRITPPGQNKIPSAVNSVGSCTGGNTETSIYNVHIFTRVSKPALFTGPFKSMFYLELIRYVCNGGSFF